MRRVSLRVVCVAIAVASAGALVHGALTEMAGAVPPPVITTDYAVYPPPAAVPAGCTGGLGGLGVLVGYRAFIDPAGVDPARIAANPTAFADPGPTVTPFATMRSLRRFQTLIQPADRVVIRWESWATGCESLTISFPLKATNQPFFDIADDQALVREPNGPFTFPFCNAATDPCPGPTGGFELAHVIPQLTVVCGFQLDVIIGGPLSIVGPNGSYYGNTIRQNAVNLGLGTFNVNPPNMLIDSANGAMPCVIQRITIDKQWVGTGAQPPTNVPPGFLLTVTSSVSATDPTVISTATCTVVGGVFTCTYEDAASPGVPQAGLLVNPGSSLLNVVETGFPGNSVDITVPVGMSSRFVTCQGLSGPCVVTITNTPPPPPPPPPTEPPTAPPPTPPPPTDTPPSLVSTTLTIPPTLPPTGSSGLLPFSVVALVLLPLGAVIVMATRRRATD